MSKDENGNHVLDHPEYAQELPLRKYIREELTDRQRKGLVVEDLDGIVRWYGPERGRDDEGEFMLVEHKCKNAKLKYAQEKTFGLVDKVLRLGDPVGKHYIGYYLLHADFEEETKAVIWPVKVNGIALQKVEFDAWVNGDKKLPSKRLK